MAEGHGAARLAAERAAALLAPPAAARRLEGDARDEGAQERPGAEPVEVVRVVGHGQPVHVGRGGHFGSERLRLGAFVARRRPARVRPAGGVSLVGGRHALTAHSRDTADAHAGQPSLDQLAEGLLTLAAGDGVDEGEAAQQVDAHLAVAAGAAEDDACTRQRRLDACRQRQRGGVLVEHAGEAHHGRRWPRRSRAGRRPGVRPPVLRRHAAERAAPRSPAACRRTARRVRALRLPGCFARRRRRPAAAAAGATPRKPGRRGGPEAARWRSHRRRRRR